MTFEITLMNKDKPTIIEKTVINHTLYLMSMDDPSPFPVIARVM